MDTRCFNATCRQITGSLRFASVISEEKMRKKQEKPQKVTRKNRAAYSREVLLKAYNSVKHENTPIQTAARRFGIPTQTLRDRVIGLVDPYSDAVGADPLLSQDEELPVVEHAETMAQLGFGYTHMQLRSLAGDLAYCLGRRSNSKPLSQNWLNGFLVRWNDRLRSLSPRSLESCRAKASTPECIASYYEELQKVMTKYNLEDKPHLIYNVDETGLQPNHTPPNIIANPNNKPQEVVSPRSSTCTLIGCANAIGNSIPPFFIFKGVRYNPDLMEGASPGAVGIMSDSGWVNTAIFERYVKEHFMKYRQVPQDPDQKMLLMYDGHKSHISLSLIQVAKEHNIILFVLPPHTSHLLQPLDVSVYGPFKVFYHSECHIFMGKNMGRMVTRFDICNVACKAYAKAMTINNVTAAFQKTGIFPMSKKSVPPEKLFPAEAFREKEPEKKVAAMKKGKEAVEKFLELKMEKMREETSKKESEEEKNSKVTKTDKTVKLKKPNPGGQAITEDLFENRMMEYEESRPEPQQKLSKQSAKVTKSAKKTNPKLKIQTKPSTRKRKTSPDSPQPSTSGCNQNNNMGNDDNDTYDEEKCWICKKWEPPQLKDLDYLIIVKWAQCDKCSKWVHLKFCTTVTFVRRHGQFTCPLCSE